jgi:AcrR family transcriptional regulator
MMESGGSRDLTVQARIVEAARRCFRRDGVRKTRIAAVATEAGMVRQTVYDFVENREQLIGLAMAARMTEFAGPVKERFHAGGDVADDLVELLAVMTEVMNTDPECTELAAGMTPQQALRFMSGPDSAAQPVVVDILGATYERAGHAGLLRAGLTVDEMAAWARNALAPLAQRDDLSPAELRSVIRRFVLPAFLEAT